MCRDEDAPAQIPDESAVKPDGWLDNEPEYIGDPDAIKPEDWYRNTHSHIFSVIQKSLFLSQRSALALQDICGYLLNYY